ncbi:adenylate/guanylate cyclase domain-containing protein [Sinorhizobium mexicanum]|uniref:Adenylate/guanylate cyclase domain-containing protein n=1 Tax=Sinorhizobium mexicanum TaxID=375549 RepID=A0A859QEI7_9HYPH|nr:adenylate/guanylate cyclase domain-containing protein [Sinorhizobium mexicanum]MBP1887045.1 TolB-like protein/class 3 adenylate cyclase/Tfp pilus assembly protein PilF [Sinorhizobium mexicanum]QLL61474.1 adenylate/guanylate cyclase domain-containing protein [Sinorhizobium mexicanum]
MDRKLAAILAADVVGYSRHMERDEQGTYERLVVSRKELFEPEVARHHGRIFKLMGDGLLAEFSSVVDAVECAVARQRGLAERNAGVSAEDRIEVRIGINLGEVIVEGDDRYGEGVNIATRLEQVAEPGTVYVSEKVAREVERKLAFGFERMGSQHVKNISEPVTLYRVKLDGLPKSRIRPTGWLARHRWIGPAAAAALAAVIAGVAALGIPARFQQPRLISDDRPSLAVLPFDNLGGDAKWDRIADGLTEDIITDLSHTRDLVVVARTSTERYKGMDVDAQKVGRELGVRYLLEGSLQADGDELRITSQLIDAITGGHIWSQRFDRHAEDIFKVQTEVTGSIATRLAGYSGQLAGAELEIIRRKPPGNLNAYETYLLGVQAKHQVTRDSLAEAERLFKKALELDPNMARAYVALTYVYSYMLDLGIAPPEELLPKQRDAAQRAVTLDPSDGETHLAMGASHSFSGEPELALAEFTKAEQLAPNNADILILIAWYLPALGESEKAVGLADRAVLLNPLHPDWYTQGLANVYFFGRQFEKSAKHARLVPSPFALDRAFEAMALAYLGKQNEASKAASQVKELGPDWNAEQYLSNIGGYPEPEAELFVEGARRAGLPACVHNDAAAKQPNFIHVKSCDTERTKAASG